MEISQLIEKRIFESPINLFMSDGTKVDDKQFISEFQSLVLAFKEYKDNQQSIGIKLAKEPRYLQVMLAAMYVGLPYVPMRANYPEDRVNQIKEEAGFSLLIDESMLKSIYQNYSSQKFELENIRPKELEPNDTFYTICTSGSTGRPKAVVTKRSALKDFWNWCNTYFDHLNSESKILQVADFTFDISLIDVGLYLHKNATIQFSSFSSNIFTLALELEKYQINFLNTVVNNFNMLLEDAVITRTNIKDLKSVVMGGARFTTGLYDKCKKHLSHIKVHNLYGVTEVPVYSHAKRMNFDESDFDNCNISVGKTLGSTTAVIVKDQKVVPQGSKGELLLGGGQLMKKYANNPEKTKEVLIQFEGKTYYRTGDISYQSQNGEYYIVGRMDDTIKYRGYRINLLDIDSYIMRLPYIENTVTFAIPNELTQNKTICYLKTNQTKTINEIKKDLADVLLEYQIPELIKIVDTFPLNENGKICKKTLRSFHL